MSNRNPHVSFNKRDQRLDIVIDEDKGFHFFPFYPSLGFINRGIKTQMSERLFNSIIDGKKAIILKWLNCETDNWDSPELENKTDAKGEYVKRKIRRGLSFVARDMGGAEFSTLFSNKNSGYATEDGVVNFLEQSIEKTWTVITTTRMFMDNNLQINSNIVRLFFVSPELTGNSVLYIERLQIIFDQDQRYSHTIITFKSLGDVLNQLNKNIDTLVSFAAPGESAPFPMIAPKQKIKIKDKNGNNIASKHSQETKTRYGLTADEWIINSKAWVDFYSTLKDDDANIDKTKFKEVLYYNDNNKINTSKFDEYKAHDIPNTKDTWLSLLVIANIGAKYCQVDFNGVAFTSAFAFFGGIIDKTDTTGLKVYQPKPLFLTNISAPFRDQIALHSIVKEFAAISGALSADFFLLNETIKEYAQLLYDPNKKRDSQGVIGGFKVRKKDFTLEDKELQVSEGILLQPNNSATPTIKMFGANNLVFNKYAKDYIMNPTFNKSTGKTTVDEVDNFTVENLGEFFATNWLLYMYDDTLTLGVKKVSNWKDTLSKGLEGGAKVMGAVVGAGAAIASGGTLSGLLNNKAATGAAILGMGGAMVDSIMSVLPDEWFNTINDFWTSNPINFLIPSHLWSVIKAGVFTKKIIPLDLIQQPRNNYLSPIVNTKIYNVAITGELTDKMEVANKDGYIKIGSVRKEFDTSVLVKQDSTFKARKLNPIANSDANASYHIHYIQIKALTTTPVRITFFNKDKVVVWETTIQSQNEYTGNPLEWHTTLLLSDYNSNKDYLTEQYEDKNPERIGEAGSDKWKNLRGYRLTMRSYYSTTKTMAINGKDSTNIYPFNCEKPLNLPQDLSDIPAAKKGERSWFYGKAVKNWESQLEISDTDFDYIKRQAVGVAIETKLDAYNYWKAQQTRDRPEGDTYSIKTSFRIKATLKLFHYISGVPVFLGDFRIGETSNTLDEHIFKVENNNNLMRRTWYPQWSNWQYSLNINSNNTIEGDTGASFFRYRMDWIHLPEMVWDTEDNYWIIKMPSHLANTDMVANVKLDIHAGDGSLTEKWIQTIWGSLELRVIGAKVWMEKD